jgi:TetR/AcrR family transcriptional regulator, cholesterol catabolism regulator
VQDQGRQAPGGVRGGVSDLPLTMQAARGCARDRIIAVVVSMLEAGGTAGVELPEVARLAQVSLRTVYQNFGSRDGLILASVEAWMESQVYRPLVAPAPDEPLADALVRHYRYIFQPWERSPKMAEAYMRARLGPGGERLLVQGAVSEPVTRWLFKQVDPDYAEEVLVILDHVVDAAALRFAQGRRSVTEILPTIERVVRFLTTDLETQRPARGKGGRSRRARPRLSPQ